MRQARSDEAAPELGVVGCLGLAAAPTFAAMALLTAVSGGPPHTLCSVATASPLTGMTLMYLLMSAFHAGPWLKLIGTRQTGTRP